MLINHKNKAPCAPILELAFRPFFLLASVASIAAVAIWLAQLNGYWLQLNSGLSAHVWHAEQMIFGFSASIAAAFILTAVQTWTGLPSVSGKKLLGLVVIWSVARILLLINHQDILIAALVMQSVWWLLVIVSLAKILWQSGNRRNYLFVPLLSVLAAINIGLMILDINGRADLALHLSRAAVLLFGVLMAVVGGRVIPFFTKAGLQRIGTEIEVADNSIVIERSLLVLSLMGVAVFALSELINLGISPAYLMMSAGTMHLVRMSRWQGWKTTKVSLLWSLHLSYLLLGLGLILLGVSYFIDALRFSDALHLLTVGAMGLMIISMISRVSLGHTGRELKPKRIISLAFVAVVVAALTRVLLPLLYQWQWAWNVSGVLWILALMSFIASYLFILTAPKIQR